MSFRVDFNGRLKNIKKTPQGGIQAPGYLTRTGVFEYTHTDGSKTRELRHPDEVFKKDSLDSLSGAPITIDHPGDVNAGNWRKLAVGHVGDAVSQDGQYVSADVRVQDAQAVVSIESGGLVEFSCGYNCEVERTPGEYNGERYDSIQRNIVYNHVALGPRGWGRAGSSVKLRLDSSYTLFEAHEVESELHIMDPEKLIKEAHERADSAVAQSAKLSAQLDEIKSEHEQLKGKHDALVAELTKSRADSEKLSSQSHIDSLVASKLALQASAQKVLGADFTVTGKSEREVFAAAITKADSEFKADGKSDEYLKGRFEALVESAIKAPAPGMVSLAKGIVDIKEASESKYDAVLAKVRASSKDAWKQPLAMSKK